MLTKTVAEVMTPDPLLVKPETPLKQVIQLLAKNQISSLPVVNDEGKLVGVISEMDLMWQEAGVSPPAYIMVFDSIIYLENPARYHKELHKALGQTAGEVMTPKPPVIQPQKSLREAARLMHEREVLRLIVVDHDRVVGVISRGDIIQVMAAEQEETAGEPEPA